MSQYQRGDIVSLSRAQISRVQVLTTPPGPGPATYTISLPINGVPKAFSLEVMPGATLNQIAAGLLGVLQAQQTAFLTVLSTTPWVVLMAGSLGQPFDVTTTPNLLPEKLQEPVMALNSETQEPLGPVRIIESVSTLERLREYATRDPDGTVRQVNQLRGRELDTGNVFDFEARQILTVLETVASGRINQAPSEGGP